MVVAADEVCIGGGVTAVAERDNGGWVATAAGEARGARQGGTCGVCQGARSTYFIAKHYVWTVIFLFERFLH